LVSHESYGDFAATLAHEIGHHINYRLNALCRLELFLYEFAPELSRVTPNMRRVSRYDDYFSQSKDEFYAETWSFYLCGENKPTLFRYLNRPLTRLRSWHPEKARLIAEHRALAESTERKAQHRA